VLFGAEVDVALGNGGNGKAQSAPGIVAFEVLLARVEDMSNISASCA
jgi:hypothetical protein